MGGTALLIGAIAGTVVQTVGQIQSGNAANAVSRRNAEIARRDSVVAQQTADFNAQLAEQEAANALLIADLNAQSLQADATATTDSAEVDREIQDRVDKRQIARDRARRSASGVNTGTGSPLLVEAEDLFTSELNQSNIVFRGAVESTRLRNMANLELFRGGIESSRFKSQAFNVRRTGQIRSTQLRDQAALDVFAGSQAKTASRIGAGSTILTGAASTASTANKGGFGKQFKGFLN